MFKEIKKCRVCGNEDLSPVLDLGVHCIDGVFPKSPDQKIDSLPLELVKCRESSSRDNCGLLQLKHSYAFEKTYWEGHGYRSGLNPSMVSSLQRIAKKAVLRAPLEPGDVVLDIGSNDGTLLKAYPEGQYKHYPRSSGVGKAS